MTKLSQTEQQQVDEFVAANDRCPVIEGSVIGKGGEGGIYTLENNTMFKLNRNECAALPKGYPKWKGIS